MAVSRRVVAARPGPSTRCRGVRTRPSRDPRDIMFAVASHDRQVPLVVALNKDELQVLDIFCTHCLVRAYWQPRPVLPTTPGRPTACSRYRRTTDRPLYAFRVGFSRCRDWRGYVGQCAPRLTIWSSWLAARKGLGPLDLAERLATRGGNRRNGAGRPVLRGNREGAWQVSHDAGGGAQTRSNRLRLRPRTRYDPG